MVLGDSPDLAFVVEIDPTKRIDHLKTLIKERRPDVFGDIMSIHVVLWKVKIPLDVPNKKLSALTKKSSACIETELGGEKLRALQRITDVFPVETQDEIIEVLTERSISVIKDEHTSPLFNAETVTTSKKNPSNHSENEKRPNKRPRILSPPPYQDDESQASLTQDTSRLSSSQSLARQLKGKGLEFYYDAGKSATATPTWSITKVEDAKRVEKMVFEFLKARKLPEEWPVDGFVIEDCTAFMQMVADSGQGLLGSKITKKYFLKVIRTFHDLVCIYFHSDLFFFHFNTSHIYSIFDIDRGKVSEFCVYQKLLQYMEHSQGEYRQRSLHGEASNNSL